MTDHPSTFEGTPNNSGETAWDDHASLISVESKDDIFASSGSARSGTFAEMIRHIAALPEGERAGYLIEKAGDRQYTADEAVALAQRADFPQRGEG